MNMEVYLVLLFHALTTVVYVQAETSPTGCSYTSNRRATCDFASWNPPLADSQFSPGTVSDVILQNVNGNIPAEAFSGLDGPTGNTNGLALEITIQCSLEDVVLEDSTFTSNLNWVKTMSFENCYIREGIPSNRLANLSALETLNINSGIVGPLTDSSFAGLSSLKTLVINSDFLDNPLPSGVFLPLTSIQLINLQSSTLSSLSSGSLSGLSSLQTLDLSSNSLTTLPYGLFNSISQLTKVTLTSNSWDCTCDLAWLSTWALYSSVTIDVMCTTPSSVSGLALTQAVLSLGCSNIYSAAKNTQETEDDRARMYAFIATGIAGLACIIAGILACVLCYMCNTAVKPPIKVTPHNTTYRKLQKQQSPARVTTVSNIEPRPPSYRSADRLFVPSPTAQRTPRSTEPYINVDYNTTF